MEAFEPSFNTFQNELLPAVACQERLLCSHPWLQVFGSQWLNVLICSMVPFRCFWSWVSFNCLALSVGYLCRYRTAEVISHYAIWCRHNYKITVCNYSFWDRHMIKFTAASFSRKSFFIFHSPGWVGGFRKQVRGCLPGKRAGQEVGRGGLWAHRGGGSPVQVCGQVWPGSATPAPLSPVTPAPCSVVYLRSDIPFHTWVSMQA